jgi:ribosomal protein S18 acetylase RimI-like enzyme
VTGAATGRPLAGDQDWWRLRSLLTELVPLVPPGFCWDVRRLDGSRFYHPDPDRNPEWQTEARLWETADGRLVSAVNHDSRGDAHLQVHADFRRLEEEMVGWAEQRAWSLERGGGRQVWLFVQDWDEPRQGLLERRGYERTPSWGVTRRMILGTGRIEEPVVAEGYVVRTTRPDDDYDCRQVAELLNAAFGRTFHTAAEYEAFARLAPAFDADLDLVAVAPDGTLAAYVGVPYDEANRRGIFEPVCTHPEHRRRGLAEALMREGLRRLEARGAHDVVVDTGDMEAANALYRTLGFTEEYRGHVWQKILQ